MGVQEGERTCYFSLFLFPLLLMVYLDRRTQICVGNVLVWPVVGLGEFLLALVENEPSAGSRKAGGLGRVGMSGSSECLSR